MDENQTEGCLKCSWLWDLGLLQNEDFLKPREAGDFLNAHPPETSGHILHCWEGDVAKAGTLSGLWAP